MYFLGIDLGSSSIKLSVLNAETEKCMASISVPDFELEMKAPRHGWAEQEPEMWWQYVKEGIAKLKEVHQIEIEKHRPFFWKQQ